MYSPLVTRSIPCKNYNPRTASIDTITIHCTAGQMSYDGMYSHFLSQPVSANYGITLDGEIIGIVEEENRAWTTSSSANDHRAITIEVSSDSKSPYTVSDKCLESLHKLLCDIVRRRGLYPLLWKNDSKAKSSPGYQNMTVHRWFANTDCPGSFLMDRMASIAEKVNTSLSSPAQPSPAQPSPAQESSGKLWKVQCGAFSTEALARTRVSDLKKAGFDAFVFQ